MDNNNVKYFIVLENRPGDYDLVDINKLDISDGQVTNNLSVVDIFTSRYTEEEIKESIARSNMVRQEYLNGQLRIVSDAGHNLRVLTKEMFEEIVDVIMGKVELDNVLKSKLQSVYKQTLEKICDSSTIIQSFLLKFKDAIKTNNISDLFKYIDILPYNKSRLIYFMIYDEVEKKKELNVKKLEKANDFE